MKYSMEMVQKGQYGNIDCILKNKNGCNCFCGRFVFFRREPAASGGTRATMRIPKDEDGGWQLLAARGWRDFCFLHGHLLKIKLFGHAYKRHDSPEDGGEQQASKTRAAGGL